MSTRRWSGRPQAVRHQLSVRIDGDGVDPAVVARDWLVQEGFGSDPTA